MKNDFLRINVTSEIRRKMIEIARQFRKESTEGERILLSALRGKKLDRIKFRRQQPVGYFVVDFYPFSLRLTVEQNLPVALDMIRGKIQQIKQNPSFPSPHVGED